MTGLEFVKLLKGVIENIFTVNNLKNVLGLLVLFAFIMSIFSVTFTVFYEGKPTEILISPNQSQIVEESRFKVSYDNAEGSCVDLTVFDLKRNINYPVPICNDIKFPLENWGFIQINEVYPKYGQVSFYIYRTYKLNFLYPFSILVILLFGIGMLIRRYIKHS